MSPTADISQYKTLTGSYRFDIGNKDFDNAFDNNVTINGGTLSGNTGIYCNSGTSTYTMNGGEIKVTNIGVRQQAENCHFVMNGGKVESTSYGIYRYGHYSKTNARIRSEKMAG